MQRRRFLRSWFGVGVYLRVLLALRISITLWAEGSFAAPVSLTQPTSSLYIQQNTGEWREVQGATPSFNNTDLVTLEASEERGSTSLSGNAHAGVGGASGLNKERGALFLPVVFGKKASFVSLLLIASLLCIWLRGGISHQKKSEITSRLAEGKGTAEGESRKPAKGVEAGTRERLTKIKALLPAVERLASAVNTEESSQLLTAVQKILGDADLAASAADSQKLERALENALGALRKLHGAAVDQGNEVVRADESILPIYPLGSSEWEKYAISTSFKGGHMGPTVDPFAMAYQAVYKCSEALYDRYAYAHERLSKGHRFEDENDGELLLEAALLMESLRSLSAERRHLSARALELKEGIIGGVQFCFLVELGEAALSLEADLGWLRAYGAALRDAAEESKHFAAASLLASEGPDLRTVEENIKQLEGVLAQMNAELESARGSGTLEAVIEARHRTDALKKEANELLQKYTKSDAFSDLPHSLSPRARQALLAMAERAYQTVNLMNSTVRRATMEVKVSCANLLKYSGTLGGNTAHQLALYSRLLETAKTDALNGDACVKETAALVERIRQSKRFAPAMREAMKTKVLVRNQKATMAAALLGVLQFIQLGIFEEDIEHIVRGASLAALRTSHLTTYEKQRYKKTLKELSAARKAAREAETFMEAAKAVGKMRSCAFTLSDILYRYEPRKD